MTSRRSMFSLLVFTCALALGCGGPASHQSAEHGSTAEPDRLAEQPQQATQDEPAEDDIHRESGVLGDGSAAGNGNSRVRNLEADGNLESTTRLECLDASSVRNSMTPADLFLAIDRCLQTNDTGRAARLYVFAMAYGRFDTLRVDDRSAHQAIAVIRMQVFGGLNEEQLERFQQEAISLLQDGRTNPALCTALQQAGAPSYHPRYMIQHGMGAFVGQSTPDGLVEGFDSAASWQDLLEGFMRCGAPTGQSTIPSSE